MPESMKPAERLAAVFDGEMIDRVPFALKGWRIPQCEAERKLRNDGMCVLDAAPVYKMASPNTTTETRSYVRDGIRYSETISRTPEGCVTAVTRPVAENQTERTTWQIEMPFKGPEDYDPILFMVRDRRYVPDDDSFLSACARMGDDAFFKTTAPGSPLHHIIYRIMGIETFSIEWAERRDRVIELHDAMAENEREIYRIVARSPAHVVQCGGNYAPEVHGRERFVDYVVPHWEEVGAILHEEGKLLGCHLDANNRVWAQEIADSPLDWIEAFSPEPDTDMTVAEAREMWPDKVLFINFPSALHLAEPDTIRAATEKILREAAPGDRFIVGITENVPEDRWRESFPVILDACNTVGRLPISTE